MTPLQAFFTLHRDLPREGPGLPADVEWALGVAGTGPGARVCDAGCGPGADSETLAERLPGARIEGIDSTAQFIEAARDRLARFGDRVVMRQGDMARIEGPFDLIWSAGAVYFLGVQQALTLWRDALAPGGRVAFSEPVLLDDTPSDAVRDFWADYPAITDMEGIASRVAAAGYRVLGQRIVAGAAWEAYYTPQQARIDRLRAEGTTAELDAVLQEAETEIARWRADPDHVAYALLVVAPA